jgi:hypothetical protein
MIKYFAGVLCGAMVAILAVVSCSDDAVAPVDAQQPAVCDCPAAEPPLAGRVVRIEGTGDIDANAPASASARCPSDATLLSGSCTLEEHDAAITVNESGFPNSGQVWRCEWNNPGSNANVGIATAVCLVPPGTDLADAAP